MANSIDLQSKGKAKFTVGKILMASKTMYVNIVKILCAIYAKLRLHFDECSRAPTASWDKKDTARAVKILIEHMLVADQGGTIFCRIVIFSYLCSKALSGKRQSLDQNFKVGPSAKRKAFVVILFRYNLFTIKSLPDKNTTV